MTRPSLVGALEEVLLQGRTLLCTLGSQAYARSLDEPSGASLGAHYRHVLDHFLCLLEGIQTGQINYDQRQRSPELESSVPAALRATDRLLQQFRQLPTDMLQRPCTVVYSVAYGESDTVAVASNLAREIMFCVGHAIHHYAILKLLCAGMAVELPYEFGVAPSTLRYQEAGMAG
jgi:uncharacterized damage-inducible protein DinB